VPVPPGARDYTADPASRTPDEVHAIQSNTHSALEKYKGAESDEDRAAAEEDLRKAVAEHFDALLKQREDQLADLQKRLETLTQELQKRRDAKQEIVDLRVEVLLNEAKGLGFYPEGDGETVYRYWPDSTWAREMIVAPRSTTPNSR
jgi:hypothetical protein